MAKSGLHATAYSHDAVNLLGVLQNFDFEITNAEEDGKAVNDRWGEAQSVGSTWRGTAEYLVDASATLLATAASNDIEIALTWNTGANAYSGNAIIATAGHRVARNALQTQRVTLSGVGAPTITPPV